jgi:glycosyltransferase involved in cell wall biosynthesis
MRVRFSPDVFRLQTVGGVSRYFIELHDGLRQRQVDSRIISGLHINELVNATEAASGISVRPLAHLRPTQLATRLADAVWSRCLARLMHSSDIFHATWYPAYIPQGPRLAVTIFDMIHELFPSSFTHAETTSEAKRRWCKSADLVLAISESAKADLVEIFGVDPSRVLVTSLGVRYVEPSPIPQPAGGRPFLLFVGDRRAPYKNFTRLIEALRSPVVSSDVALVCAGPPASAEDIGLTESAGLANRVFFVTAPNDTELAAYYRGAVALVYPSLYEGFGLPPLEAMMQGCPVICSMAGALSETVGDAAACIDPLDSEAIANVIARVLGADEVRSDLVRRGHERAEMFTWDRMVDRTLEGYRSCFGP